MRLPAHLFTNRELSAALEAIRKSNGALHIFGLVSDGGVHSHENQIHAMIEMAAKFGLHKVYLHAFLDGRDTPPKSAEIFLQRRDDLFEFLGREFEGHGEI